MLCKSKKFFAVLQQQNGLATPATGSSASFVTPSQMGSAGMVPPPVQRGGPGAPGRGGQPPSTGNDRGRSGGFPLGMGG